MWCGCDCCHQAFSFIWNERRYYQNKHIIALGGRVPKLGLCPLILHNHPACIGLTPKYFWSSVIITIITEDKMLVLYRVEVMWCTRRRRIQRKARMRVRQPSSVLQWADRFAVFQGFNHISTQRLGNNRNFNKSCSRKRHQQCVD